MLPTLPPGHADVSNKREAPAGIAEPATKKPRRLLADVDNSGSLAKPPTELLPVRPNGATSPADPPTVDPDALLLALTGASAGGPAPAPSAAALQIMQQQAMFLMAQRVLAQAQADVMAWSRENLGHMPLPGVPAPSPTLALGGAVPMRKPPGATTPATTLLLQARMAALLAQSKAPRSTHVAKSAPSGARKKLMPPWKLLQPDLSRAHPPGIPRKRFLMPGRAGPYDPISVTARVAPVASVPFTGGQWKCRRRLCSKTHRPCGGALVLIGRVNKYLEKDRAVNRVVQTLKDLKERQLSRLQLGKATEQNTNGAAASTQGIALFLAGLKDDAVKAEDEASKARMLSSTDGAGAAMKLLAESRGGLLSDSLFVQGSCASCLVCGDRPEHLAKARKRRAWQRYCRVCDEVFAVNGFFSDHGGPDSSGWHHPLEQRTRKHKKKLLSMVMAGDRHDSIPFNSPAHPLHKMRNELRWAMCATKMMSMGVSSFLGEHTMSNEVISQVEIQTSQVEQEQAAQRQQQQQQQQQQQPPQVQQPLAPNNEVPC